jgi:hypothetical protein
MGRTRILLRETFALVRRNRLFFLLPILLSLAILAFLVFTAGPTAILTFIYAGI